MVFVKQLGRHPVDNNYLTERSLWPKNGPSFHPHLSDRKGGDMVEWPYDVRVREMA
jgi:hypothetical protein